MSSPLSSYNTTASPASTSTSTPSRTWTPITNPIPFHPSVIAPTSASARFSPARLYTLHQTVFLLSYFIFRFSALVADPVPTMIEMLVPLAIAQGVWCVVCLPRSGYWDSENTKPFTEDDGKSGVSSTKSSTPKRKAASQRFGFLGGSGGGSDTITNRIITLIFTLILTLSTLPAPFLILLLLFGAPLTTHIPPTALLATHLSLLLGPPLFYTHGVSTPAWREIVSFQLPLDEPGVWGGSLGALLGCWLGAVPIPLDWDREWQKWPVTVVTGAWLGWAMGRTVLGPLWGKGRRVDLREWDGRDGAEKKKDK